MNRFTSFLSRLLNPDHDAASLGAVPCITVEELHRRVSQGEATYLLDVRTPEEFRAFHLSFTSARIPHDSLAGSLHELPVDQATPIFTFCRSGRRSAYAAAYLRSVGYRNAFNVTGGILAWIKAGFEIESS